MQVQNSVVSGRSEGKILAFIQCQQSCATHHCRFEKQLEFQQAAFLAQTCYPHLLGMSCEAVAQEKCHKMLPLHDLHQEVNTEPKANTDSLSAG